MHDYIPTQSFLSQYAYEIKCWERWLSFQKEELVSYKNRLAEVVNGSADADVIRTADDFQESFLAQEQVVHFLTGELARQKTALEATSCQAASHARMVVSQKNLRREMKEGEASFVLVKAGFARFLDERFGLTSA